MSGDPAATDTHPVSVAVVDSGAHTPHPHLPRVAGGVALFPDGRVSEDWTDRLGHGTAAAAAIHEKAPDAELWAVKVFERELATNVPTLVRAVDWAVERGIRLVNLSLGTRNKLREPELGPAIERAVAAGTIIVSAHEHEGRLWYPGSMPGVAGVVADRAQARDRVGITELPRGTALVASPFPRPIPGVPPERNMHGISFAVANATGVLARLLAARPEIRTARDAVAALREDPPGGRADEAGHGERDSPADEQPAPTGDGPIDGGPDPGAS